jgi:hypothetical protein
MIAEISFDNLKFLVVKTLLCLRVEVRSQRVGGGSSTEQPSNKFDHDGDYNGDCRNNVMSSSNLLLKRIVTKRNIKAKIK